MNIERTAEDTERFNQDMKRIHDLYQSQGPKPGQVWIGNKTGREVFIKSSDQGIDCVTFQYFETGRICDWFWTRFVKEFTFDHHHD